MPPESVERHFKRPSFHSLSFSFAMDDHSDHSSALPADNAVQARNLLDDAKASHPTSPFDKTGMGHNDPQTILNDLYPPSARHRGRSIDGSNGADMESESVRQILLQRLPHLTFRNYAIQSYSSVVYLGHNVFETHKTFLHRPTSKQPQQGIRPSTADLSRSDGYSKSAFESHVVDQAIIDSDIVHWATGIPDSLPLTLSTLATMLPDSPDREPPTTEYLRMASLAIFQCSERRLTEEGIFSIFIECLQWFRIHRDDVVWKVRTAIISIMTDLPDLRYFQHGLIKYMLSDSRFKAIYEEDKFWTIDISEIHRRPFVHREARDRPMRLLPPGPKAHAKDKIAAPHISAETKEMGPALSFAVPVGNTTGINARHGLQHHSPAISTTSHGALSGTSSSFNPTNYTMSPANSPHQPQRNLNTSGNLPSYSEILCSGDAHGDHTRASPADFNHLVLPSIREVLGPEMYLVEERRRTNRS
jgi:hypothetical protein